ncbi:MAG: DUF2914 domain-containing protein [Pseudomonadota bacterium]|nr:MAG: DUF2914 domain-containing protein [Pseudomonadota bacterium]
MPCLLAIVPVFVLCGWSAGLVAEPASQATAERTAASSKGYVARAQFTTEIIDREPADQILTLGSDVDTVYFFTDLRHLDGHAVTHRWEYRGEVVSSVDFEVKGPRWRVYSKKTLAPTLLGKWTVVVTDERGWPLKVVIFEYVDAGEVKGAPAILPPGIRN